MASQSPAPINKSFSHDEVEFVTKNFTMILDNDSTPSEFHLIHDFLAPSPIGYALTNPSSISAKSVLQIWRNASYTASGENTPPRINFMHGGNSYTITSAVVRAALHLLEVNTFTTLFSYTDMHNIISQI